MRNNTYKFTDENIKLLKFISQLNALAEQSGDDNRNKFLAYSRIQDTDVIQKSGVCIDLTSNMFLYDDTNPIEGPAGMTWYPLIRTVSITPEHRIISCYDNIFMQDNSNDPPCLVACPNLDNTYDCIYIEDGEWFL